jgi:hypothetical protein
MSSRYSIAPAAAMRDARVTLVGKAILSLLGTYTDAQGWCHPTQATLAEHLGVSREYVQRTIRTLVQIGYIETRSFSASRRGRVALEYRVKTDLPDEVVQAAEKSRCEPDVISSSQRPSKPLKEAVVIHSSQRADVISSSQRKEDSSLRSESSNDPNKKKSPKWPDGFEEAWSRWPQRTRSSKKDASTAWAAKLKAHGAPALAAAVDAYLASDDAKRQGGKFVPAFERWIAKRLESWVEQSARLTLVHSVADEAEFQRRWLAAGNDPLPEWANDPQPQDLFQATGSKP